MAVTIKSRNIKLVCVLPATALSSTNDDYEVFC